MANEVIEELLSYEQRRYYEEFLDFLQAVGYYLAIVKMDANVSEGVHPVQKVAYEYGYTGAYMDMEIDKRERKRWQKLDSLDYWSKRAGFPPLSLDDKNKVMKFAENGDRRRYLRDNIKREMNNGEVLSIRDFIVRRYDLEKKKREKEKKAEN